MAKKANRQPIFTTAAGGMGKTWLVREIAKQVESANTPTLPKSLRVFICHSSNDKPAVRDMYNRLISYQIDLWLDEEKLLPGQDWNLEIAKAVRVSDVVLICLSRHSVTKAGYVQKEIKYALDFADEQPEGTIFLIPVKLEECEIPERLHRWQWVELNSDSGFEKLVQSLKYRAQTLGLTVNLR